MSNELWKLPSQKTATKSNEWFTSSRYIEAARMVMGGIDLDPASCELANRTVKATRYYTIEDDGLKHHWTGNVWLNPPFGRRDAAANGFGGGKTIMGIFIKKLIDEYQTRNVDQAILLATAKTDASWFPRLWDFPLCVADHRVIFTRLDDEPQGHFYGTIFVYLGPNEQRFIEGFSQFGRIVRAIDTPAPRPMARELWTGSEVVA